MRLMRFQVLVPAMARHLGATLGMVQRLRKVDTSAKCDDRAPTQHPCNLDLFFGKGYVYASFSREISGLFQAIAGCAASIVSAFRIQGLNISRQQNRYRPRPSLWRIAVLTSCRICGVAITPFMTFGRMPIANGFIRPEEVGHDEYVFELAPAFCSCCGMVQLVEQPTPEAMFHENYAFFSGTSRYMQRHFQGFAERVMDGHLAGRADPFVVELGSNDGIMMRHFAGRGIRHLGVEPSENVAAAARAQGVNTRCAFFGKGVAAEIVAEYGQADAILAANVMCHIPDLHSVAAGMALLLKPDGLLMFEDPYVGDMIEKTSYDQFYDEHVFMFSATSVQNAFARHGLELIGVEPQITHGGSMRYILAPNGSRVAAPEVAALVAREREMQLDRPEAYDRFRANCEQSRTDLMALLNRLKAEGKRVAGYGATSKSTTVTTYCGITSEHVAFISDTTPIKQGKLSPGAHIPIRPYEDFQANPPDYALLFAWNHKAEIMEKEDSFRDKGGKWIVYVPKVEVF